MTKHTETVIIARRPGWEFMGELSIEITCDPTASQPIKLGLAVRAALKSKANLTYANLTYANLRSANLTSANLRSANLTYADLRSADLTSADLTYADLTYANLTSANLTSANLRSANLTYANLTYANLTYANLTYANLTYANLRSADLTSAKNLGEFTMTDGLKFSQYLAEVVPALLTAGGKTMEQIKESGCWDCHSWENCPMHVAFGIATASEGPALLRSRIVEFIQFFDAKLIPAPWA